MTRRRHPAQASRIMAAGLSTATMLAIVAVLAGPPAAEQPITSRDAPAGAAGAPRDTGTAAAPRQTGSAPPKVAARRAGHARALRRTPPTRAPVTTTGPS